MDQATYSDTKSTGWTSWIVFAAVMMMIGGVLNMSYGLIAVLNDDWVVFGNTANLYLDFTAWGWVQILIGAVVLLAGLGLFSGNVLARTVGVVVASISILVNFFWLPAYPLWAIIVITLDVLIIWALTVHGRELAD